MAKKIKRERLNNNRFFRHHICPWCFRELSFYGTFLPRKPLRQRCLCGGEFSLQIFHGRLVTHKVLETPTPIDG